MAKQDDAFLEKIYNPALQAAAAFAFGTFITLMAKFVGATGLMDVTDRFAWMSAAAMMLLFAVFNSVISLSAPKISKYWGRSIYCFAALAAVSGLFAWFMTGMSIGEAGSYKWIYFVVTIGYLVFLSMMGFMKFIVDFAQREEWNNPRLRRKKKR